MSPIISLFSGSRIALSSPAFIASTVNPKFTSFLAGRLKEMLLTAAVICMVGYCARIVLITSVIIAMPSSDVHSISISGSIWILLVSILYSFAFSMILPNTSSLFSAVCGIPVSSHSSATTSHPGFSATIGKSWSILSPSMDTELIIPGLLQHLYASLSTFALGLSTAIGRSVTLSTRPIIHFSVSTSTSSSTDAHTSIKVAPASASFFAISLIHSSSRAAIAFAMDGMEPFIFSPIIIIGIIPLALIRLYYNI